MGDRQIVKILHVYKTYYPDTFGGVETFIDQLILSTKPYGHQSEILSLTKNPTSSIVEINGYKVHKIKQNFEIASCPFSLEALSIFSVLAAKADIIHYHFPWPFADLLHLLSRTKTPSVLTYHSDIIKQQFLLKFYTPLMQQFLNKVHCIVATSPNYSASSPILRKLTHKTEVVPLGLDKDHYPNPSNEKIDFWRTRFPNRFFLFIGSFRYYKGLPFLIEAAKNIDAPIVMIGTENAFAKELKAKALNLGLKNIHFLGALPEEDKVALLMLCYALVLPSHLRSEAFGLSLLEGAMFEKPLISCEIGTGTSYINLHDETGMVVPPADALALNKAMRFLLDHPNQTELMGHRAGERYKRMFMAKNMAESYIKIYERVLKNTSA